MKIGPVPDLQELPWSCIVKGLPPSGLPLLVPGTLPCFATSVTGLLSLSDSGCDRAVTSDTAIYPITDTAFVKRDLLHIVFINRNQN